jgi:protein TonB
VGGTVGGTIGGVVGATGSGEPDPDEPRELANGFRKPTESQRDCVVHAMRVPPQLAGFVSGPIAIRFVVGRNGEASRAAVLTAVPDSRIERAILAAVQGCKWIPGADAEGRPIALWVRTSIRFTSSR